MGAGWLGAPALRSVARDLARMAESGGVAEGGQAKGSLLDRARGGVKPVLGVRET